MQDGNVGFVIFVIVVFIAIFFLEKSRRKSKAQAKAMGAYDSANCFHEHGIIQLQKRESVDLFLLDKKIVIKSKDLAIELPIERLTAAQYLRKTDLLKENKSAIARGIVGGVLIGPLGAIVGSVSGVGDKHKKGNYLVINYTSADSNEVQVLIFDMILYQVADRMAKALTKQIISSNTNNGVIQL